MEYQEFAAEAYELLGTGRNAEKDLLLPRAEEDGPPLGLFVGLFWGVPVSMTLWIAFTIGVLELVHGR